jgi:hypothetical protein
MNVIHRNLQMVLNEREIKTLSVVRNKNLMVFYVPRKILKILSPDIMENRGSIIEGDRRDDVSWATQPGCFDIQIGNGMPKLREQPPVLMWWQESCKVMGVISLKMPDRFVKMTR